MLGLPSCKKVSEQSSLQLDENLPLARRVGFKLHLMMCVRCRRYAQKMRVTSQSLKIWMTRKTMPEPIKRQLLDDFEQTDFNQQDVKQKDDKQNGDNVVKYNGKSDSTI